MANNDKCHSSKKSNATPVKVAAPNISNLVILKDGIDLINRPFKTVNNEAKKAEIIPKVIPNAYLNSKPKMMVIPAIIIKLIIISYRLIFLPKIKGYNIEVNKVDKVIQTTPMETVLTFIAKKKENQCKPMIHPTPTSNKICFADKVTFLFINNPIKNNDRDAMSVRKKTILNEMFA